MREIAVVGAQHRPAWCGLSKTDRPVRAGVCVDRSDFVIVLSGPFRGSFHHRLHGVGAAAQQQIVEILPFIWRQRDPDPSAFRCEPVRGGFGGALACAGAVMIGENDDALCLRRQRHLFQVRGRQRRPDRQMRAGGHDGERGLDAFGEPEESVGDVGEAHGAAAGRTEHLARIIDRRLCRAVIGEISAMERDAIAEVVAHDGYEAGKSAAALPMRQVGVEEKVGATGRRQARAMSDIVPPESLRSAPPVTE